MTEKDYASADVMVLGLVATCMAGGNEAAYIMQAIQKFGVKTNWFHSVQHQRFFDAVLQRAVQLAGNLCKLMVGMAVVSGLAAEGDDLPALQIRPPALPVVVM